MAFKAVEKGTFTGKKAPIDRVTISSNVQGAISLSMSHDIFATLGEPRFVKIAVGSGEHSGMVLVKPSPVAANAYRTTANGSPSMRDRTQRKVTLSQSKLGLKKAKRPATELRHKLTEEGLVLWLPQDIAA